MNTSTLRDLDYEGAHDPTEHVVVGPPGCGKTTWLARQANRAALVHGGQNVAIISLTRAAAAEVAGRKTSIPDRNIGTLHAHAYRALKQPPLAETPEAVKEWNEVCGASSWKLRGTSTDTDVDLVRFGEDGDKLLQQINVLRAKETDIRLWPPNLLSFHRAWTDWKEQTGRLDFQDIIDRAYDSEPYLPWRPLVLMVDEAQDMSAKEMRLIRRWSRSALQLVVVGDPDQALYTWRGASPKAVFGEDPTAVRVLSQSYRVPAAVHAQAVQLIQRIPNRLEVAYHPRKDEAGVEVPGHVEHLPAQINDPEPIIDQIRRELEDPDRTVMVLTSCGYMLTPLCQRMKDLGIPFHNPYRTTQGAWNPLGGVRRLMAYLRPKKDVWGDQQRMWNWDDVRLFTEPMQSKGVLIHGAKTKIARLAEPYTMGAPHEDVPITQLLEFFHPAHHDTLFSIDVEWWHSCLKASEAKRLRFGIDVLTQHGPSGLTQDPRVIVGTIHSVKGAEADTVILFPDLSHAGYYDGLQRSGEKHDSIWRLFYVGVTRSKDRLLLGRATEAEAITW